MSVSRILCPLDCGWHHDEDRAQLPTGVTVNVTAAMAAGDVRNAIVEAMALRQVQDAEGIIQAHLETHTLLEWVKAVQVAKQQLADEKARQEAYEESVVGALNERNTRDARRAGRAEAAIERVRAILDPTSWARDLDIIEALEQP